MTDEKPKLPATVLDVPNDDFYKLGLRKGAFLAAAYGQAYLHMSVDDDGSLVTKVYSAKDVLDGSDPKPV